MKSPLAVLVAAVLAASLRVAEPAEAATVSVNINSNIIEVTGVIDRATVSEFTAGATRIRDYYYLDGTMVVLNSEGGDLVAAMEIGQIIRSRSLLTDVGGTARCASACVFILAAGVDRSAYGKIGIHRPHFDDRYFADLTLAQARAKYEQLQTMARSYLREMGMPDDLYIEMMRIPSDGIRWLSPERAISWVWTVSIRLMKSGYALSMPNSLAPMATSATFPVGNCSISAGPSEGVVRIL
jgi:hypothetical protein